MNPNSAYTRNSTFQNQQILNEVPRDQQAEQRALAYLDKWAPDLVPMILGGVL